MNFSRVSENLGPSLERVAGGTSSNKSTRKGNLHLPTYTPVHFSAASAAPVLGNNGFYLSRGGAAGFCVCRSWAPRLWPLPSHLVRDCGRVSLSAELRKRQVVVPEAVALGTAAHEVRHGDAGEGAVGSLAGTLVWQCSTATRPPDAEVPRHLGELLGSVVGRDEPERARVAPRQHLAVAREEDAARAVHPLCDDVRRQRVPVL